jgi:hypothetical protein
MTTKPINGYRLDSTGKLVKRRRKLAAHERKRLEGRAAREERQWLKKSKPRRDE